MSKYIIVGGVAGGATAAARLRRIDEKSEIIIFEKGPHMSYANCGLPYYIGDIITERENLFVQTPESFGKRFKADVRVNNEVVSINRDAKTVKVKELITGKEYNESYEKLLLSPGASPTRPPIPGINHPTIFSLRNVIDTDRIKEFIQQEKPKKVAVIGAGFIGLEMAENLHHLGLKVTIVEAAQQVMNFLDYEMAAQVHQHLKVKGVEFYLNDAVSNFEHDGKKHNIHLNSGKTVATDFVILSIGVKPENKLARESDLKIGELGGILVNEYLQTSDPEIYAVGDAIEFVSPIIGKSTITYLAGPANKQGRIVADNIVRNNKIIYKGSVATSIAKIFDITVGSCGIPEKILKKENIAYLSSIIHGSSHAGYYPGALPLTLKITFSPDTGKLFGAQSVGYEGVDKRIDVISAILKTGGSIYDLQEMEHSYAPPFSSAKDPVNIAGFTAENIINGSMKIVQWQDVLERDKKEVVLLDVRTADEFELGTIDDAINIPLDEIRDRIEEISTDKKIYVFCGVGLRAYVAVRILSQRGYEEVYNLSGGCKIYDYVTQNQSNEDIFENDYIGKDDHIYQRTPEIDKIINADNNIDMESIKEIDACGLQCPGPIIRLKNEIDKINTGELIRQIATDPGFHNDIKAWCNVTGNKLVSLDQDKGKTIALIQKGTAPKKVEGDKNNKTIVVFSDNMDKALASFVIANGAAATGKKVTMFFTFWGLSVIKKQEKVRAEKDAMGKMFSMMLPSNSQKLSLSKMNMGNMGRFMMKKRMESQKIDSLEQMILVAKENNVKMMACQMSMDMMGIKKEELLDTTSIGGVASYLEETEQSNLNLFI